MATSTWIRALIFLASILLISLYREYSAVNRTSPLLNQANNTIILWDPTHLPLISLPQTTNEEKSDIITKNDQTHNTPIPLNPTTTNIPTLTQSNNNDNEIKTLNNQTDNMTIEQINNQINNSIIDPFFWLNFTLKEEENVEQCIKRAANHTADKESFYLSAVLYFRIWDADWCKTDFGVLLNWMEYLFFAGVEHLYAYDNYHFPEESMQQNLQPYIDAGLVTYIPWFSNQNDAYGNSLKWTEESKWMLQCDLDEYPYYRRSQEPGWLRHFIEETEKYRPLISRIYIKNHFYFGPRNKENNSLPLYLNFMYRSRDEFPVARRKVIFRMQDANSQIVHTVHGTGVETTEHDLESRHFWGRRHCPASMDDLDFDDTMLLTYNNMKRERSWILPCLYQGFVGYTPCTEGNWNCSEHIKVSISDILHRTGHVLYSSTG